MDFDIYLIAFRLLARAMRLDVCFSFALFSGMELR